MWKLLPSPNIQEAIHAGTESYERTRAESRARYASYVVVRSARMLKASDMEIVLIHYEYLLRHALTAGLTQSQMTQIIDRGLT